MPKRNRYYDKVNTVFRTSPKSKDKKDIVEWLAKSNCVEWMITYYSKATMDYENKHLQDKVQDIYLYMLDNMSQEKWDSLYEQGIPAIRAYVSGIVITEIRSTTSPLYRKYDRYDSKFIRQDDEFWQDYYDNTPENNCD